MVEVGLLDYSALLSCRVYFDYRNGMEWLGVVGTGMAWCFKSGAERSGRDRNGMGSLTYI